MTNCQQLCSAGCHDDAHCIHEQCSTLCTLNSDRALVPQEDPLWNTEPSPRMMEETKEDGFTGHQQPSHGIPTALPIAQEGSQSLTASPGYILVLPLFLLIGALCFLIGVLTLLPSHEE